MERKNIPNFANKTLLTKTYQGHIIYLLSNGLKYKEFNQDNDFYSKDNLLFMKGLIEQTKETSAIIAFPISIVMDSKKLYGIISPYIPGIPLSKMNQQITINSLLNQISKLEKEIERLTKKGWFLDDINENNIITNNQKEGLRLSIIDTDFYTKRNLPYNELLRSNRMLLVKSIIESFIPGILVSKIMKDKKIERSYSLAINGLLPATDFLVILINKLNQYQQIDTIESFVKAF